MSRTLSTEHVTYRLRRRTRASTARYATLRVGQDAYLYDTAAATPTSERWPPTWRWTTGQVPNPNPDPSSPSCSVKLAAAGRARVQSELVDAYGNRTEAVRWAAPKVACWIDKPSPPSPSRSDPTRPLAGSGARNPRVEGSTYFLGPLRKTSIITTPGRSLTTTSLLERFRDPLPLAEPPFAPAGTRPATVPSPGPISTTGLGISRRSPAPIAAVATSATTPPTKTFRRSRRSTAQAAATRRSRPAPPTTVVFRWSPSPWTCRASPRR